MGTGQTFKGDAAAYAISAARVDGGGTFDPYTGHRVSLSGGFVVGVGMLEVSDRYALHAGGPALVLPDGASYSPAGRRTVGAVLERVRDLRTAYASDVPEGHPSGLWALPNGDAVVTLYAGAWHDGGVTYWEVSAHVLSERHAAGLARARGEREVWDVDARESVVVGALYGDPVAPEPA